MRTTEYLMRRQPKWSQARPPSKSKRAKYDEQNSIAAEIILADTTKHTDFQVRWAKAFMRRRAEENGAKGYVYSKVATVITDSAIGLTLHKCLPSNSR